MQQAIDETNRRRELQLAYNEANGITPETIRKAIRKGIEEEIAAHNLVQETAGSDETHYVTQEFINELEAEMMKAAEGLEFERAAQLRDRIMQLKQQIGQEVPLSDSARSTKQSKKSRRGRKGSGRGGRVPKPEKPA